MTTTKCIKKGTLLSKSKIFKEIILENNKVDLDEIIISKFKFLMQNETCPHLLTYSKNIKKLGVNGFF
jgi:hypothetical protein